jgi:hypothetical protein
LKPISEHIHFNFRISNNSGFFGRELPADWYSMRPQTVSAIEAMSAGDENKNNHLFYIILLAYLYSLNIV